MSFGREIKDFIGGAMDAYTRVSEAKYKRDMADLANTDKKNQIGAGNAFTEAYQRQQAQKPAPPGLPIPSTQQTPAPTPIAQPSTPAPGLAQPATPLANPVTPPADPAGASSMPPGYADGGVVQTQDPNAPGAAPPPSPAAPAPAAPVAPPSNPPPPANGAPVPPPAPATPPMPAPGNGAPMPAPAAPPQGQNGGAPALQRGDGAASADELRMIGAAVDPQRELTQGQRLYNGLQAGYNYYIQHGDPEGAARFSASMLQGMRQNAELYGAQALTAMKKGDMVSAAGLLQTMHDLTPDGMQSKVTPTKDGVDVQLFDMKGKALGTQHLNADDITNIVGQAQDFNKWQDHILEQEKQREVGRHNLADEANQRIDANARMTEAGAAVMNAHTMQGHLALAQNEQSFTQGNVTADRTRGSAITSAGESLSTAMDDLDRATNPPDGSAPDPAKVQAAQAALSAAKAGLSQARAGAQPTTLNTVSTYSDRDQATAQREEALQLRTEQVQSQQALRSAQTDLAAARANYERTKSDKDKAALDVKEQAVITAQQRANITAQRLNQQPKPSPPLTMNDQEQATMAVDAVMKASGVSDTAAPYVRSIASDIYDPQNNNRWSATDAARAATGYVTGQKGYYLDPAKPMLHVPGGVVTLSQRAWEQLSSQASQPGQTPAPQPRPSLVQRMGNAVGFGAPGVADYTGGASNGLPASSAPAPQPRPGASTPNGVPAPSTASGPAQQSQSEEQWQAAYQQEFQRLMSLAHPHATAGQVRTQAYNNTVRAIGPEPAPSFLGIPVLPQGQRSVSSAPSR